jgi:hypothetical protein
LWSEEFISDCLRPCDVLERSFTSGSGDDDDDSNEGAITYNVVVFNWDSLAPIPARCGSELPDDGVAVVGVPSDFLVLQNKPYQSPVHRPSAFRHEIGLPIGFYPEAWTAHDTNPNGDFLRDVPTRPLPPGRVEPVRWSDTKKVVTNWAFRIGIGPRIREVLLEYCQLKGITDALRHVTTEGNGFVPGQESKVVLDGHEWFLQRPGKKWHSNLHWISPNGPEAHDDYLQALQVAGFDDVLKSIGDYLQLDGLVAFHVTFIGVSQAIRGYMHLDVSGTQAKTYNVIIPLILAEQVTAPELDLQGGSDTDRRHDIGRYKYVYDEAAMMGDDAFHATSSVDYRPSKEMRLAATVYIADVNEQNVDRIMQEYTQAYPPQDRELLLGWAGRHWKPGDPSRKLPEPPKDHVLVRGARLATVDSKRDDTVSNGTDSAPVQKTPAKSGAVLSAVTVNSHHESANAPADRLNEEVHSEL